MCVINPFVSSSFNKLTGYTVTGKQNIEGGMVSNIPEKSVTKVYGSMLLALRGGGWVSSYVTLEWPGLKRGYRVGCC